MSKAHTSMNSIVGQLYLVASEKGLQIVSWRDPKITNAESTTSSAATKILKKAEREITEYLAGKRKIFDTPLDITGTDFQKRVWNRLSKIPYGTTKSYKQIAIEINHAKASRAVGMANNRNPICIIIPCHRVIAADGSLCGFGGGIDRKIKLLDLETQT